MIHKIQTTYPTRLEEYLSHLYNRLKGFAMVGQIGNGIYTRALVDSDQLEWIELSPDVRDSETM